MRKETKRKIRKSKFTTKRKPKFKLKINKKDKKDKKVNKNNSSSSSYETLSSNNNILNIRIVTPNSPGLINDAYTYKNIFEDNGFEADIDIISAFTKIKKTKQSLFYHLNLFLEYIPNNCDVIFPSKLNLFMPNIELFSAYKQLRNIDIVLCKTKLAHTFMEHIKTELKYDYKCYYTKFTTNITPEIVDIVEKENIIKDPNLFIHLAGKSPFKGTASLIKCWIKNNGFIKFNPHIKLIITCFGLCFDKIERLIETFDKQKITKTKDYIKYDNMTIYINKMDSDTYIDTLLSASVSISTSIMEGYGHYINESRYIKTFVITFDMKPMNELIHDNINGILLKNSKFHKSKKYSETSFVFWKAFPDLYELKQKIIYCIQNPDKIKKMGNSSQRLFEDDKRYLYSKMKMIIEENLLLE